MAAAQYWFDSHDGLRLYSLVHAGPTATAPVVLCLHGLMRNGRDFEDLAPHLASRYRVIVPDVRGRGLWVGAEIDPAFATARDVCERLVAKRVLSKETHDTVVRLAPPLVIAREDLDWAIDRFAEVLGEVAQSRRRSAAA